MEDVILWIKGTNEYHENWTTMKSNNSTVFATMRLSQPKEKFSHVNQSLFSEYSIWTMGKVLLYSPSVWSWWERRIYPFPAGFPLGGCSWSPSPWGWGWTWTARSWTPSSCTCFPSGHTSREVWPTMEEDCSWLRIECFCLHTAKKNHFCLTIDPFKVINCNSTILQGKLV